MAEEEMEGREGHPRQRVQGGAGTVAAEGGDGEQMARVP